MTVSALPFLPTRPTAQAPMRAEACLERGPPWLLPQLCHQAQTLRTLSPEKAKLWWYVRSRTTLPGAVEPRRLATLSVFRLDASRQATGRSTTVKTGLSSAAPACLSRTFLDTCGNAETLCSALTFSRRRTSLRPRGSTMVLRLRTPIFGQTYAVAWSWDERVATAIRPSRPGVTPPKAELLPTEAALDADREERDGNPQTQIWPIVGRGLLNISQSSLSILHACGSHRTSDSSCE